MHVLRQVRQTTRFHLRELRRRARRSATASSLALSTSRLLGLEQLQLGRKPLFTCSGLVSGRRPSIWPPEVERVAGDLNRADETRFVDRASKHGLLRVTLVELTPKIANWQRFVATLETQLADLLAARSTERQQELIPALNEIADTSTAPRPSSAERRPQGGQFEDASLG